MSAHEATVAIGLDTELEKEDLRQIVEQKLDDETGIDVETVLIGSWEKREKTENSAREGENQ